MFCCSFLGRGKGGGRGEHSNLWPHKNLRTVASGDGPDVGQSEVFPCQEQLQRVTEQRDALRLDLKAVQAAKSKTKTFKDLEIVETKAVQHLQ